jgi:hypothetical protein
MTDENEVNETEEIVFRCLLVDVLPFMLYS